jgi:hypothetical protein
LSARQPAIVPGNSQVFGFIRRDLALLRAVNTSDVEGRNCYLGMTAEP